MCAMTPLLRIRKEVLDLTQQEMADIAGTTQATVSRWERGGSLEPSRDQMERIRAEAARQGKAWNDAWFFDVPATPKEAA